MSDLSMPLTGGIVMKTREEIVVDTLRSAILHGKFMPGEKLEQQDLADLLGVSRSPIREALRTLAAEELIVNIPHRGAVVTERSITELEELIFIRGMLEGAAAKRAALAMTNDRLDKLAAMIATAKDATDLEHLLKLNNDFHSTLYEAFEQPTLIATIQQLRNKFAAYTRIYLDVEGRKEQAWADHQRIFEACQKKDGDSAEIETRHHLDQVFQGILIATK